LKIVVLISADGEWRAVKSLLPDIVASQTPFGESFERAVEDLPVVFFQGGWGRTSASATTQYVIDHLRPDLLVNLGTCGGFQGSIQQGTILLVEQTVIYDILEQMTDTAAAIEHYSTRLDLTWLPRLTPSPVSRARLVSGDRDIVPEEIPNLIRVYDAVAADWESGAIAWVAHHNHQRLLILRGVSDLVGVEGGEVYGDYELFQSRTREIMRHLLEVLPKWLRAIEKVQLGYRV
jgi:adenosylhomocysteine nucleosidase